MGNGNFAFFDDKDFVFQKGLIEDLEKVITGLGSGDGLSVGHGGLVMTDVHRSVN